MNTNKKCKLSRALWLLLTLCGIFMICSLQVDALGDNPGTNKEIYDITDYKAVVFPGYDKRDYYGIDILCSSELTTNHHINHVVRIGIKDR